MAKKEERFEVIFLSLIHICVICRTVSGDLAILARHCNYCTALGMGEASVVMEDGSRRTAACIGGMLSVMNGKCRVLATTWEWKEDIDEQRAQEAKKRAEEMIAKGGLSDHDYKIVEAKLQRALAVSYTHLLWMQPQVMRKR